MPNWAAKYYEKLIDSTLDFYLQPFCEKILEKYPGPISILDIGTGTGQLPIMLAKNNKNYKLTAIDLSEKCLKFARSKAISAGVSSQITFVCMDLLQNNWNVESFDLIISTCSLHHWRRPESLLSKARQLINDNGEVWILDDFSDITIEARKIWTEKVECAYKVGLLFRTIFGFESKFLAYSRIEVEEMCKNAKLNLLIFSTRDVFFIAQMTRN